MKFQTLGSSLLMIPRELPAYLSVAKSLRYNQKTNFIKSFCLFVPQYMKLIQELLKDLIFPSLVSIQTNTAKLEADFKVINKGLKNGNREICVYVVCAKDGNGALLGNPLYYYHHYKIRQLQKHYDVAVKIIRNEDDLFNKLNRVKHKYKREIKVVDIVAHGCSSMMDIPSKRIFGLDCSGKDKFYDCASDAVIILDACSTAEGSNSLADRIAKNNRGKTVIAPEAPLFFSKPVFKKENDKVVVKDVVHGFAIFNAYTSRKFKYEPDNSLLSYINPKTLWDNFTFYLP